MERLRQRVIHGAPAWVLVGLLAACSQNDRIRGERAAKGSVQLAPFHEKIALPHARHARLWEPPDTGPVPVVEVLRDGSWILDGVEIRDDSGDGLVTLRRLLYEQARRMPRVPLWEEGTGPTIPRNPLFLRVDRDAPWSAVRPVLASCALQGIYIFDIDIQVESDGQALRVVRLAFPRVIGIICYSGLPRVRSLILEAGTPLRTHGRLGEPLPVDLELRGREHLPEEAQAIEIRLRDDQALVAKLRKTAEAIGCVEILLPESAPAWVGVLAVDLAVEAGIPFVEVPVLSLDELEKL